jgi:hypothetical protein
MDKPNLWVFGDSFSVPFHKMGNDCQYLTYQENVPKIYSEIISDKLNYNLKDMSVGGCSNYTIFHTFIKVIDLIGPDDILIFGWTQVIRFRVASKINNFYDVLIAVAPQMSDMTDFSINVLNQLNINHSEKSIYFDELCDFIKIINKITSKNKTLHWTWVEPTKQIDIDVNQYEKKYYELLVPFKKYKTVRQETNNKIDDFHYGGDGHNDLANDLLEKLKNFN